MITSTQISKQYFPTSGTKRFSFPIAYFVDEDINVTIVDDLGNSTDLTLNAPTNGFTVEAVNGDPNSGATITTATYYSDVTVTIYRIIPITQENEFLRGGDVPPDVLNSSFDRATAVDQQSDSKLSRSISCPITDPDGLILEVPTVELRKNKIIGFDENGNIAVYDR